MRNEQQLKLLNVSCSFTYRSRRISAILRYSKIFYKKNINDRSTFPSEISIWTQITCATRKGRLTQKYEFFVYEIITRR